MIIINRRTKNERMKRKNEWNYSKLFISITTT